jgi:quaternary ammonium compound-resistance protein SugE
MAWIYLFIAGLFESVWAVSMKQSDGFSRPWPTVITLVAMLVSIVLLGLAMRSLPVGPAYAVWTGIGVVGAFIAGIFLLGEAVTPLKLVAFAMIVGGIALMKLASD